MSGKTEKKIRKQHRREEKVVMSKLGQKLTAIAASQVVQHFRQHVSQLPFLKRANIAMKIFIGRY